VVHHSIGGSSQGAPFAMIVAHHRSLWRFAVRSTTGVRRVLLPAVALGLLVRAALIAVRRVVLPAPPAALH
jgi:hypothetical protein